MRVFVRAYERTYWCMYVFVSLSWSLLFTLLCTGPFPCLCSARSLSLFVLSVAILSNDVDLIMFVMVLSGQRIEPSLEWAVRLWHLESWSSDDTICRSRWGRVWRSCLSWPGYDSCQVLKNWLVLFHVIFWIIPHFSMYRMLAALNKCAVKCRRIDSIETRDYTSTSFRKTSILNWVLTV